MLPLAPSRKPRASSTPEAHVSTLKPGGNLNLEVGSLSGAVGIGNAGTGAICWATSDFGRPLAHPGSSAGGGFGWASVGGPMQQSVASTTSERTCFMTCLLGGSWADDSEGSPQLGKSVRPASVDISAGPLQRDCYTFLGVPSNCSAASRPVPLLYFFFTAPPTTEI